VHTAAANLVSALSDARAAPLRMVEVLSGTERREVPTGWNGTAAAVPAAHVPELFEAQAARVPEAIAVACECSMVSYGQPNARANRLARVLAAREIGPESVAAVVMERSADLVVALLAVLKVGGAYLPVDPGYPGQRIAFMLADAKPACVITASGMKECLSPVSSGVRTLIPGERRPAAELGKAASGNLHGNERVSALSPGYSAVIKR
jgi:non-ribosomal peptide synthetase component F